MWLVGVLLLVFARAVEAQPVGVQPAACAPAPPSGPVLPLGINIAGRAGVPKGVTGQVYVGVPAGAPEGNVCREETPPPPPRDILGGPPSSDLLRGPDEKPDH